ncbi:MAG TPA: alkaline phosphatase D family protein [Thermoleophilaceae bacterium]|nr:alkaline phosphatase D family protein [Thermoleophilaceae bacterium]
MPHSLVLGPLLRYVGEDEAVIWVETDGPCEVEVLGSSERTFHVEGHHYGLVRAEGLRPGTWHEYEVRLDGELVWPEPDSQFPPSAFRTYPKDGPLQVVFGSCRVTAPHDRPYALRKDEDERGREIDALRALSHRMAKHDRENWPDVLLLLGDQVYADEVSPATAAYIESRRDPTVEPGDRVVDFEEYTRLYREAWGEPSIRWLFSTLSTAMIFDDHDVHDDWNTSQAWVREMRSKDWWDEHIVAALMSYWIYQHVGNLAPESHREDELLARVREAEDGGPALREFARRADRETSGSRWSYCRDLGDTRIVVIDSRAGRVLDDGRRAMVDDEEWDWIVEHATGGFDHLLIATSLPYLLAPALHYLEAWNEAVCAGAWGDELTALGERVRQTMDLEHWAAFGASFDKLTELQRSVAAGERGPAPASIVTLSGDVHHAYLCEVAFPRGSGVRSAVWQAVCSPFRNPLDAKARRSIKALCSRGAHAFARWLARTADVDDPPIRWRLTGGGPWFDNQYGVLDIDGRRIDFRLERAQPDGDNPGEARLESVLERRLA